MNANDISSETIKLIQRPMNDLIKMAVVFLFKNKTIKRVAV